jgi:hypothetical protein
MLGLAEVVPVCLLDIDGVLTQTAEVLLPLSKRGFPRR